MDRAALIAKCPKKVWVGTYEFLIHFVERPHAKLDGDESDGCTEFTPPEIYVCASLGLSTLLETVIHEITHAVDFVGDIEDGTLEETVADKHGKIWSQFWIQNPRFARWWLSACVAVRKEQSGVTEKKRKEKPQ